MTALSEDTIRTQSTEGGNRSLICRASTTFRQGALVGHRIGSELAETPLSTAPRNDLLIRGRMVNPGFITSSSTDSVSGGALINATDTVPAVCEIAHGYIADLATGTGDNAITAADIGRPCYAFDTNTVYRTQGDRSFAGFVQYVDLASGLVTIFVPEHPLPAYVFGDGSEIDAVLEDGATGSSAPHMARAVVTSLAANSHSAGVITADAAGALGAQDGLTLVAGDVVLIQEGTTNLDAAAQAGPYVVTTVGDGSTAFVLTRPSWWAHGDVIPQASVVKIGGEGTLWRGSSWKSFVAKAQTIGTDAPLMFPDFVCQGALTLVAGTLAVTNVPILSATKTQFVVMRTTPTGTANTIDYNVITITPGAIGTATCTINAQIAAGTINAADGSVVRLGITNW